MARRHRFSLNVHSVRRLVQTFSFLALNPYIFRMKSVCLPVLNCWGCPLAAFACPVGVAGEFLSRGLFPFLTLGVAALVGLAAGRILCGWVCPFGFLQELLHKIPGPKLSMSGGWGYLKYGVLAAMVIVIPYYAGISLSTGKPLTASNFFFCHSCPAGTLESSTFLFGGWPKKAESRAPDIRLREEGAVESSVLNALRNPAGDTGNEDPYEGGLAAVEFIVTRFGIAGVFVALFVLVKRPFCRAVCPVGAFVALFNRLSLYKPTYDAGQCAECDWCGSNCPVALRGAHEIEKEECIRCLECSRCPKHAVKL